MADQPTTVRPMTVTIHGTWDVTPGRVADIIAQALCKADLCGCNPTASNYTMSVTFDDETADAST